MGRDPYRYFRIEAAELVEGLSAGVLALERGVVDDAVIARLLRLAHTLKGAARVVRQAAIAEIAHAMEDILAGQRGATTPLAPGRCGELLAHLDVIAGHVRGLDAAPAADGDGGNGAAVVTPVPAMAMAMASATSSALPSPPALATDTAPATAAAPATLTGDAAAQTVRVEIAELDILLRGVNEAGVQVGGLRREHGDVARLAGVARLLVDQLTSRLLASSGPGAAAVAHARALADELDGGLGRLQRELATATDRVGGELSRVRDVTQRLRLVPASTAFPALTRAARDAAQLLDRRVDLEASGGDVRLDAHVLAASRDALLHLVRNAVAHGIEPAAARVAAGKPAVGRIAVEVERHAGRITFRCRDDGRGIDDAAVRRVAVARGVVTAAEAAGLDADGVIALLLRGGVSTAATLTEVAGRGVGLDVVRATAQRLKGVVTVRSTPGHGTTVALEVPVSLASIAALVVEAGGAAVAIPLDAVERTARIRATELASSETGDALIVDGVVVPFFALAPALRRTTPPAAAPPLVWSVVIVQAGGRRAAVGVDRLLGVDELVVRPLPATVAAAAIVGGASLDADGTPRLVLDAAGVIAAAERATGRVVAVATPPRPILVVDDSLTTRMLEQSILETAGYAVEVAVSAEDALAKSRDRRYSLFVVDVEMPGMDGFEFVARTRSDPALQAVPAILVTSRGSADDRRRGEQAGARAHIVKGEFDQGHLLTTIRDLIGAP